MKKVLLGLALVCLLLSALGGAAGAQAPTLTSLTATPASSGSALFTSAWIMPRDVSTPTCSAIAPTSAPNDIDTAVTITGTGFATDGTGTIPPTVSLGDRALIDVIVVDATTLTATVPWGMDPGVHTLAVTNPDGGSASLANAFTVTPTFTVKVIIPASGPNDHDTAVSVRGTGFATDLTGTVPPTITLGGTMLTNVTLVSVRTLSATVPKGLAPGLYTLTVYNPGHTGSASLADAFTVTPPPTVSAVDPPTAYNDIDQPITITGANFATDATGTVSPTGTIGGLALLDVTYVDATTLTAKVPWGMDPGTYDLTVTNPDGGIGGLTAAYAVEQGIAQWNGGELFGGRVDQIVMKPGDSDTLYAVASGIIGAFRSTDAGEHWTYLPTDAGIGGGQLVIDPLHPSWLYCCAWSGLHRSTDEGDTWTTVMSMTWPDGRRIGDGPAYPSPYDPQTLFISSELGLIKSTDGGTSWKIVADMEGIGVSDVAYRPTDPLQMALATADGRVFRSTSAGDTWSEVTKPPISHVGWSGSIAFNPYMPGEVWVAGDNGAIGSGKICKSTDPAFTAWQDVLSAPWFNGTNFVSFTGVDSIHIQNYHSTDGGLTWPKFDTPMGSTGAFSIDPYDPQIIYAGDLTYGVQKTTDGGAHWDIKSQGLTGMVPSSMEVSRADPLRVFATFPGWPGIYRSDDGAKDWTFTPFAGGGGALVIREDPSDPERIYAAGEGLMTSTDGGTKWSDLGWTGVPSTEHGVPAVMKVDPHQSGHLLVGFNSWVGNTSQVGQLYGSIDHGASWRAATVPQDLAEITDIAFDPETPGRVYLTTRGTGVYRSTDGGTAWERIDDPQQPHMQNAGSIAIATHPQHVLSVGAGPAFRSFDGGATWKAASFAGSMFIDGDSTRLYAGGFFGLYFSNDAGDSCKPAAGAFGHLQIMALGYADMDGHTIIYAATNAGQASATRSAAGATSQRAATGASSPVTAGIYRFVVATPKLTLKLSGLSSGALKLGKRVTAKGVVTPAGLAGSKVTLTVQRRQNGHWHRAASLTRTISAGGIYSRTYEPAKKGSYRVRASIIKSATNMAARTAWRTFRVK